MNRPLLAPALAVAVVLLASAGDASAQTTGAAGTTGAGSFSAADMFITVQDVLGTNLTNYELARFFNKRNCDCTEDAFVRVGLSSTGFAKRPQLQAQQTGTFLVMIGAQCDQILYRASCLTLASIQLGTFLSQGNDTFKTTARQMSTQTSAQTSVDGGTTGGGTFQETQTCTSPQNGFNQTVWAMMDFGADGTIDVSTTLPVKIDLTPPPAPDPLTLRVDPGNQAVTVSWTPINFATNMDLAGYQILCRRGADIPVFAPGAFTPYVRSCPATREASGLKGPEALDPAYVCSPLLSRSTSSFRIKILQNDIVYGATVVAIDNSGNASIPDVREARPERTISFYDYYRNGDVTNGAPGDTSTPGLATGGFCAVAAGPESRGRLAGAATVLLGAAGVALLLRARRRGRRS